MADTFKPGDICEYSFGEENKCRRVAMVRLISFMKMSMGLDMRRNDNGKMQIPGRCDH